MQSTRRVSRQDYWLIKAAITSHLDKLRKRPASKSWLKFIDVEHSVQAVLQAEHAYIVGDAYLVVFDLAVPWYSPDVLMLQERVVLSLVKGGDFAEVPAFLERMAQEAGARLVGVGTALTRNDAALASVYERFGYKVETRILTKEIGN